MSTLVENSGYWASGANSRDDPAYLPKTAYVWAINMINRGGIMQTRPGNNEIIAPPVAGVQDDQFTPQGITVFTGRTGTVYLVMAYLGLIYTTPYPFIGTWTQLPNIKFQPWAMILFETGLKQEITNPDGSVTIIDNPYPVLIMQDGQSRAAFWDEQTSRHLDPTNNPAASETPTGQAMKWSGSRLWVAQGNKVFASNLTDPLKFTETNGTNTNAFFSLPEAATCMGETPDTKTLLVFGLNTTTAFQSSVFDRNQWQNTVNFQSVLFPNIGCVGPKAFINQYGLSWWFTPNGIIALDNALFTYRTSRIEYRDQAMMRSKSNLSLDFLFRVCAGTWENFLFFSVPSGGKHNEHTWVSDQSPMDVIQVASQERIHEEAWVGIFKGIRPVEWVTKTINGRPRCFCLSRDYAPNGKPKQYQLGIWEAFCSQHADTKLDGSVKRIRWSMENRVMMYADSQEAIAPKKIRNAEIDCTEEVGEIDYRISYAGRRSTFKQVASKHVVASEGSIGGPDQLIMNQDTILESYRPQDRIIRTPEINEDPLPGNRAVQSTYPRNIDRGFQIYVEGDGQTAIKAIRIFAETWEEAISGVCEPDETTARIVDGDGDEFVKTTPPIPEVAHPWMGEFHVATPERVPEIVYSSR